MHQTILDFVKENVIGSDVAFCGPFGERKGMVLVCECACVYLLSILREEAVG